MSDDAAAIISYRLEKIHNAIKGALHSAGTELGNDSVRIIKGLISLPYPPASQPGEPPHRRIGRLREGYTSKVTDFSDYVEVEISSSVEYSVYLEYGTRHMAPRPHFRPAMEVAKTSIPVLVATHVELAVAAEVARMGGH